MGVLAAVLLVIGGGNNASASPMSCKGLVRVYFRNPAPAHYVNLGFVIVGGTGLKGTTLATSVRTAAQQTVKTLEADALVFEHTGGAETTALGGVQFEGSNATWLSGYAFVTEEVPPPPAQEFCARFASFEKRRARPL